MLVHEIDTEIVECFLDAFSENRRKFLCHGIKLQSFVVNTASVSDGSKNHGAERIRMLLGKSRLFFIISIGLNDIGKG